MSDAADETAPLGETTNVDGVHGASRARAQGVSTFALAGDSCEALERHRPLLQLLRASPDVIIEQLCERRPRDFVVECAEHAQDNAYFFESGRLAARVIAMLASLSGAPAETAAAAIDTVIEEATASLLEEEALSSDGDSDCAVDPICEKISRTLGLDATSARDVLPLLNGFGFADRHVLFHCIVEGLSPEAYAKAFDDNARVVAKMLAEVARLAIEESAHDG